MASREELHDIADKMNEAVGEVLEAVRMLRESVIALVSSTIPERPTRSDLQLLHPSIERTIRKFAGLLVGAGFVADPMFLKDAAPWVEWRMPDDKGFHPLEVTLDASLVSHYNYLEADWFVLPKEGAAQAVVGPYVDSGGTNAYVITITMPVVFEGVFIGIVGADLSVDRLEAVLRRLIRPMDIAAMIVSAEGRVVASNISRWHPGMLTRGFADAMAQRQSGRKRMAVVTFRNLPWQLIVPGCRDPRECTASGCACAFLRQTL